MSQMKNPCEACTQECFPGGCKAWREWWVQNWNQNIHRYVPPMPRRVWQYEHPDRVRETNAAEWMAKQMGVTDAQ